MDLKKIPKDILNKLNKKEVKLIVGVVIAAILVVGLTIFLFSLGGETDGEKFKSEYEEHNDKKTEDGKKYPHMSISEDNIIKYSDIEDIINIFENKEDAVVYIGYPTCLYCRHSIEVLLDTAKDTKLDVIHYLDIEDLWEVKKVNSKGKVETKQKAHERYFELLDVIGDDIVEDYVLKDKDGNIVNTESKTITVPLTMFITDGFIIGYNKGTLFSHVDPYVDLDKDQINGLKEIYGYGIRDVVNNKIKKGLIAE